MQQVSARLFDKVVPCIPQDRVPHDSDCPSVSEEDGGKSYNDIISSLFKEIKTLKQRVANGQTEDRMTSAAVEASPSNPPAALPIPPTSPSARWSSVQIENSLETPGFNMVAGNDVLKATLAFQSPLASPNKTPIASPQKPPLPSPGVQPSAMDGSITSTQTRRFEDPSEQFLRENVELGSMKDEHARATRSDRSGAFDILQLNSGDRGAVNMREKSARKGTDDVSMQPKIFEDDLPLISGGDMEGTESQVQIFVQCASLHGPPIPDPSPMERALRDKENEKRVQEENDTQTESRTGRLTPAGHISSLIRTYERSANMSTGPGGVANSAKKGCDRLIAGGNTTNSRAKADISNAVQSPQIETVDAADSMVPDAIPFSERKCMPKVLQALPSPTLVSSQSRDAVSGLGMLDGRGESQALETSKDGNLVKERRERVEQLIKRSRELAQETTGTISKGSGTKKVHPMFAWCDVSAIKA